MQAPLDARPQALRRPQGVASLTQLRLFFGGRPRLGQVLSQAGCFRGQRPEKTLRRSIWEWRNFSVPQIPHPLGYFCDWPDNRPPDHNESNQYDQENLSHHMPKRVAPDLRALGLNITGVMEDNEYTGDLRIPVQGQCKHVHRRLVDFFV